MDNSVPGLGIECKQALCTCAHCNAQASLLRPARGGKSWAALLYIIHILGFIFLWSFVPEDVAPINMAMESNNGIKSITATEIDNSIESNEPIENISRMERDASRIIIDSLREDRARSNIPFDTFVPLNIAAIKVFCYGFSWSMAFSLVLTDLFMLAMYSVPEVIINASIIVEIAQFALLAIAAIYFGYTWTGRFFCLATFIIGTNYSAERRKVPFSAAVLKITMSVLKKHPAMIAVNSGCFFVCLCYQTAVLRMLDHILTLYMKQQPHVIFLAIYCVFTVFWSARVTYKIAHFVVASVYTTDLYSSISNQKVQNPTTKSLKRALTSSFGIICYESLIPQFGALSIRDWDSPFDNRRAKSCTLMVLLSICMTVGSSVYLLASRYFNLPRDLSVKYALILGMLSYVVPFTAVDIIEKANEVILKCFSKDPLAFAHSKDGHYNKIAHTYHYVFV